MTSFLASWGEPPASVSASSDVVLVTRDAGLAAEVQRLAAAAGTPVDVVTAVSEVWSHWSALALVLLGADTVADAAATAPPRRDGVHVLASGALPDGTFRAALAVGAESVLELPAAETWLVETLTDAADGTTVRVPVVGVVGGCGGAGATTFATALAVTAATGQRPAILVDADPLGPGLERVAGLDVEQGAGWAELEQSVGRLASRALRASLPHRDGLSVLGWGDGPRPELQPRVAREAVSAAARGGSLVVVDLPRRLDPAATEVLARCDHAVVVVPLGLSSVAASTRVVAALGQLVPHRHLVTRGRRAAVDPEDVSTALGLTLAATMSDQRRLVESVELGLGPPLPPRGPLARAARATLALIHPDLAR